MKAHMIQFPLMPSRRITSVKKFYFNSLSPAFRELVVKRLVKEEI